MAEPSLRLTEISKRYPGVQALAEVSFACLPGEIHAVLGENGSGKSTLLGIASGAIVPDSGTVEIMGARLGTADPRIARKLGLATVYQDDSLVRELTVAQNLMLAAGAPVGDPIPSTSPVPFPGWAPGTPGSPGSLPSTAIPLHPVAGDVTPWCATSKPAPMLGLCPSSGRPPLPYPRAVTS